VPILPSGKVVSINNNRVGYHLSLGDGKLESLAPLTSVHSLIDVTYYRSRDKGDFIYSGFTLSTIGQEMKNWPKDDQRVFRNWLATDEIQDYIQETANKWANKQEVPIFVPYPDGNIFYSSLKRRIEALPLHRATVQQWINTIENLTKSGIRQNEIAYSGVQAWLAQRKDTVTKRDVLAHINFYDANVHFGYEATVAFRPQLIFKEHCELLKEGKYRWLPRYPGYAVIRFISKSFGYKVVLNKQCGLFGPFSYWILLDHKNRLIHREGDSLDFVSAEAAMSAACKHAVRELSDFGSKWPLRTYAFETLHGGTDYREWLLTLPNYQKSYYSSHFSMRNIVAHVRSNERKDIKGNRLLFLEEVQSDLHQAGRKYGYQGDSRNRRSVPPAPFEKSWHELALKAMLYHAAINDLGGIAWTTGKHQIIRYPGTNNQGLAVFYDRIIPTFLNRFCKKWDMSVSETVIQTKRKMFYLGANRGKWRVYNQLFKPVTGYIKDRANAEAIIERNSRNVADKVPVLYINQAMREEVCRGGMPLFGFAS
jgi:hypothetical protein